MRPAFWQRLDSLARRLTPFGLTVILVLAALIPSHVPEFARVVPALAMVAVYHWAIHRPRLLPAWSVFVLGILQDVLSGTALKFYGPVLWPNLLTYALATIGGPGRGAVATVVLPLGNISLSSEKEWRARRDSNS